MQDFTELQELCEKHKQIVNIIKLLEDALNGEQIQDVSLLFTAGSKVKIDTDLSKQVDKQFLYSLLNGYKLVERELSQRVNNFFNHN